MSDDIQIVLNAWPYESGKNIRLIVGVDGKPKLQVRLPLGLEEYELQGRPDGRHPHGVESELDHYERKLAQHREGIGGDEGFSLSHEECAILREEGVLYYYRYLLCYQVGEYQLVVRDTERNMRLFRFVARYGEMEEDKKEVAQYWPYVKRMHATAAAFIAMGSGNPEEALRLLRNARREISELPEVETPVYVHERERSLSVLNDMIRDLQKNQPVSERQMMMRRLAKAVENEDYEQAAKLRDLIARMKE